MQEQRATQEQDPRLEGSSIINLKWHGCKLPPFFSQSSVAKAVHKVRQNG
jgi:hypothetical protein